MSYIDSLKSKIGNRIVESAVLQSAMVVEASTPSLITQLKKILADGFVFYFKAQAAHWNVEGDDFPQYHEFFGKIYEGAYATIDPLAEELRALGVYAPVSLREIMLDTSLTEFNSTMEADEMLRELGDDIQKIISALAVGQKLAEEAEETGLANYFQDLIDKNKKTAWMIKSTLKESVDFSEYSEEQIDEAYKLSAKDQRDIDAKHERQSDQEYRDNMRARNRAEAERSKTKSNKENWAASDPTGLKAHKNRLTTARKLHRLLAGHIHNMEKATTKNAAKTSRLKDTDHKEIMRHLSKLMEEVEG